MCRWASLPTESTRSILTISLAYSFCVFRKNIIKKINTNTQQSKYNFFLTKSLFKKKKKKISVRPHISYI